MEILKRPYITEKTLAAAAKGYYTFVVSDMANKGQIADAVKKQYAVDVTSLRTLRVHGKIRRVGRRQKQVCRQDWKKAIVIVKAGQKIDAFDVSREEEKK